MQQLGEHGVAGVFARVLGFEPNFVGPDIDQALGVNLETQRPDVGVFDVFFGLSDLQLGVKFHVMLKQVKDLHFALHGIT